MFLTNFVKRNEHNYNFLNSARVALFDLILWGKHLCINITITCIHMKAFLSYKDL